MYRNKYWRIATMLVICAMVAACGTTQTQAPVPTQIPPTQVQVAPTSPAVTQPTELKIALILATTMDNPWDLSFMKSFERVAAQKPHGLTLSVDYTESVWDNFDQVVREYADSGKYGIIWGHSSYADLTEKIKDDYPNIIFVDVGSGNKGLGGNAYWIYKRIHEPAYLEGIIAGKMTKSNVLGAVATFPYDDVNDVINAFYDGAKSVNPNIQYKVSFFESWYDPVKAGEATFSQIAAGADFVLQLGEAYEPCKEKNVYCFGNYMDSNYLAPDSIVTSQVAYWDPDINYVIDQLWDHTVNGKPYNASMDPVWFSMKEGGSGLAPYHNFEQIIPKDVLDLVEQTKQDIMSGSFTVPLRVENPVSP